MATEMNYDNGGVLCETRAACGNCGSPGTTIHTGLKDYLFGAPGVWSIRRCTNRGCGLGWLDPHPRADQVVKFYQRYWTHGDGAGDGEPSQVASFSSTGGKKWIKRLIADAIPWRRAAYRSDNLYLSDMPPGRLLDVGCGDGAFAASMASEGWRACGIDFDEGAVAAARRHGLIDVKVGDLIGQNYPAVSFDAIVMNNVIEHLSNPGETLAECQRILASGGRLVTITPNVESLGHAIFGADWRGLEPPRHLLLYTDRALRQVAERAGFTQIQIFSTPLDKESGTAILRTSAKIAELAGHSTPSVHVGRLMLKERLLDIAGKICGEWLVLIASK
jgi:2-polyprenyl-3-methyl-5-hydroxy-6-metoxy-1,4-benzoquinol methylase